MFGNDFSSWSKKEMSQQGNKNMGKINEIIVNFQRMVENTFLRLNIFQSTNVR